MRIAKISETQIKFTLSQADLDVHNIKISDLSRGSDKTQRLFQEMMLQAMAECEFESSDVPLMVEASPINEDSVMVVVTKLTDVTEIERKLNLIPLAKAAMRFKQVDMIEPPEESEEEDSISIFSFDTLDTLAEAAARLTSWFAGVSQVYKMDGCFYLILQNETEDDHTTADLEAILNEYGQKHISNAISKQYLAERGEALITDGAVEKLNAYMA